MLDLKPDRAPLLQPRTLRRILIAASVAIGAYALAVVFLVLSGAETTARAGAAATPLVRSILFLTGGAPPQPTCEGCTLLPRGSRVMLGTDTVAVRLELHPGSRPPSPSDAPLLIRGAISPGGAGRAPPDSGRVALVPRGTIMVGNTVVLEMITRHSAVAQGLEPRGRLFLDGPEMRTYLIFW
jgi:hypothetical protein